MNDERLTAIRERIATFPKSPGVYLMKDAKGRVLYVGKAKDLRSRVSSYFQDSADLLNTRGPEIARMAAAVVDVDFLDCETGSLVVDLDWNRNWCHCDFEAPLIASYVVPKGFVQSMELYDHELSVCEDIVCDCYGGVYDGCTGCDGVL